MNIFSIIKAYQRRKTFLNHFEIVFTCVMSQNEIIISFELNIVLVACKWAFVETEELNSPRSVMSFKKKKSFDKMSRWLFVNAKDKLCKNKKLKYSGGICKVRSLRKYGKFNWKVYVIKITHQLSVTLCSFCTHKANQSTSSDNFFGCWLVAVAYGSAQCLIR